MTPNIGFIVYGVHKDGLTDPMGTPFIDDALIENAKSALRGTGMNLIEHPVVIATKKEAREALWEMKKNDKVDCILLFSGTWVWAAHLIAAVRDFASSGKGVIIWTHPGHQGWRPVGGFVMHGALMEIGIRHEYIYGEAGDDDTIRRIASYARACRVKNGLNMSTAGSFGGRGMGQTCGAADPSQWMRTFGVDIDSRDSQELISRAEIIEKEKIDALMPRLHELFGETPKDSVVNERSIRLYLAIKEKVEENGFDFYTIQSFPGLADTYAATCFAQSMMLEDRVPTSTLGDFNTLLTVYLLTKFSDEPVYYGDLQHLDKTTGEIRIIGDGAIPPSLAGKVGPAGFAEHGIETEGSAGGLSVKLVCKAGEGVIAMLGRNRGEFQMVLTKCSIFEPSTEEAPKLMAECGIPFWPHGFVKIRCNPDELLQHWTNEYACLGYGSHIYEDMQAFCKILDIKLFAL